MYILEVCAGSYEDAINSLNGGATRIELNYGRTLGGLTPSVGSVKKCKELKGLSVISMVRPRAGGFCYSDEEYEVIFEDIESLMKAGSDGIAFGFLKENGEIDIVRTKKAVEIIKKYNGQAVFHRAFDVTPDWEKAINILIDLGVDRVLTSGQKATAIEGIELLSEINSKYGDRIEILAGSGVNISNAKEIISKTGIKQIHSSCKSYKEDLTTNLGGDVNYSYLGSDKLQSYDYVDEKLVQAITDELNQI